MGKYILHSNLGDITVLTRNDSTRLSARYRDGGLRLTVPAGTSPLMLQQFVAGNTVELMRVIEQGKTYEQAMRDNEPHYYPGYTIQGYKYTVEIRTGNDIQSDISSLLDKVGDGQFTITVSPKYDFNNEDANRHLTGHLLSLAKMQWLEVYSLAIDMIKELNITGDVRFIQGRGRVKLGHCQRDGAIQLSAYLTFLPEHLIRYVICHELAHLKHFDHSPAFHALCNQYCDGREAELEQELKLFKWPLL